MGYAAAGLVLATFSARSLTTLRALAIASNLLFIAYAACAGLAPVLVLHALLLPLNAIRLRQALTEEKRQTNSVNPSLVITRCTAGRASTRCKYGPRRGSMRAGRRMPRVQRQCMRA
jgi:hypothetical protein